MNTNIASKLIAAVIFPTLVACGGGGGGAEQGAVTSQTQTQSQSNTAPAPTPVNATAELVVAEGFSLEAESDLVLSVNNATLNTHRGYLSVCSDYEVSGDTVTYVNYDSCLLRTWVENSGYSQALAVTHNVNGLVAALWYPDLEAVDYALWQRDAGMQWTLN